MRSSYWQKKRGGAVCLEFIIGKNTDERFGVLSPNNLASSAHLHPDLRLRDLCGRLGRRIVRARCRG